MYNQKPDNRPTKMCVLGLRAMRHHRASSRAPHHSPIALTEQRGKCRPKGRGFGGVRSFAPSDVREYARVRCQDCAMLGEPNRAIGVGPGEGGKLSFKEKIKGCAHVQPSLK